MNYKHFLVVALAVALLAQASWAETVTNVFGNGDDVVLRRLGATENDGFLRIKNQSGLTEDSGNDRIGLLKFDLSGLTEPITVGALQLQLPRGASNGFPNNTFNAGETLSLYGIPNLATDENFDEAAVTFANSPYTTGGGSVFGPRPAEDTTGNGVNDTLLTLLATYTFATTSNAGQLVNFQSPQLSSFLQADTNDIASFFLTVSQSDAFKTAVFTSDTGTEGTPIPPTLRTNTDVFNTDVDGVNGTDINDFHIIRTNYLTGTSQAQGDVNFDGTVNHLDFYLWRTEFASLGGIVSGLSVIPEPSTAALGLMLLLSVTHRRLGKR
jgi:hypothetical protein